MVRLSTKTACPISPVPLRALLKTGFKSSAVGLIHNWRLQKYSTDNFVRVLQDTELMPTGLTLCRGSMNRGNRGKHLRNWMIKVCRANMNKGLELTDTEKVDRLLRIRIWLNIPRMSESISGNLLILSFVKHGIATDFTTTWLYCQTFLWTVMYILILVFLITTKNARHGSAFGPTHSIVVGTEFSTGPTRGAVGELLIWSFQDNYS